MKHAWKNHISPQIPNAYSAGVIGVGYLADISAIVP